MEMNIEGFINALYEKTNSGALGVSYIKPGNAPVTKWFTRYQFDDMAAFIRKCGKTVQHLHQYQSPAKRA